MSSLLDHPVTVTLCLVVLILSVTFGVLAVVNGIDPVVIVGLITTVIGVLAPSPLPRISEQPES